MCRDFRPACRSTLPFPVQVARLPVYATIYTSGLHTHPGVQSVSVGVQRLTYAAVHLSSSKMLLEYTDQGRLLHLQAEAGCFVEKVFDGGSKSEKACFELKNDLL